MRRRVAFRIMLAYSRIAFGVMLASMVAACGPADAGPEGSVLQHSLIGTWGASDDGGKTFVGFETYQQDGRFLSQGTLPDGTKFRLSGTFEVRGRTSCTQVMETSIPLIMPLGHISCGEILSIDGAKREIRLISSGKTYTDYRLANLAESAKK